MREGLEISELCAKAPVTFHTSPILGHSPRTFYLRLSYLVKANMLRSEQVTVALLIHSTLGPHVLQIAGQYLY